MAINLSVLRGVVLRLEFLKSTFVKFVTKASRGAATLATAVYRVSSSSTAVDGNVSDRVSMTTQIERGHPGLLGFKDPDLFDKT